MSNKKDKFQLDPGFDEVHLDDGFEEIPLHASTSLNIPSIPQNPSMLENIGQTAADTARAAGQGLTFGLSDEIIGGAKALGDVAFSDKKLSDLTDLYRKYQAIEQQKIQDAEKRSPIATTIGEIGGAIAPALLTAGASLPETAGQLTLKQILKEQGAKAAATELAKRAGKSAVIGGLDAAAYSGGKSEGKLIDATPEERAKLLEDVKEGGKLGFEIGGGLSAAGQLVKGRNVKDTIKNAALLGGTGVVAGATAGALIPGMDAKQGGVIGAVAGLGAVPFVPKEKVAKLIDDSPFLRQMKKAYSKGKEGVNISSEETKLGTPETKGLISQDTDATRDLMNRIYSVDEKLGQNVGKVIDTATENGIRINMTDELTNAGKQFVDMYSKDATIAANPKAKKLYETIFQLQRGDVTPQEIQSLRSQVVDFSDAIKIKDPYIAGFGYSFQKQIGDALKEQIPEYKVAADRFESFRRLVPETIISGSTPVDVSQVKLSKLRNEDVKLFDSIKRMIKGTTRTGNATAQEAETFSNFIRGLNEFDKQETSRVKQGLIKSEDMPKLMDTQGSQSEAVKKNLIDAADNSAMLQQAWGVNPQEGGITAVKGSLGAGFTGRGKLLTLANKWGLHQDKIVKPFTAPVKLGKKLTDASESQLRSFADKLTENPATSSLGKALMNGIDNKDQAGINAAIFSIMQTPHARIEVDMNDNDNNDHKEDNK